MVVGNAYDFSWRSATLVTRMTSHGFMAVGNSYEFFMVVGNAYHSSWWLATPMIFHGGNACEFSWWLATHMIFHSGWQRI